MANITLKDVSETTNRIVRACEALHHKSGDPSAWVNFKQTLAEETKRFYADSIQVVEVAPVNKATSAPEPKINVALSYDDWMDVLAALHGHSKRLGTIADNQAGTERAKLLGSASADFEAVMDRIDSIVHAA